MSQHPPSISDAFPIVSVPRQRSHARIRHFFFFPSARLFQATSVAGYLDGNSSAGLSHHIRNYRILTPSTTLIRLYRIYIRSLRGNWPMRHGRLTGGEVFALIPQARRCWATPGDFISFLFRHLPSKFAVQQTGHAPTI